MVDTDRISRSQAWGGVLVTEHLQWMWIPFAWPLETIGSTLYIGVLAHQMRLDRSNSILQNHAQSRPVSTLVNTCRPRVAQEPHAHTPKRDKLIAPNRGTLTTHSRLSDLGDPGATDALRAAPSCSEAGGCRGRATRRGHGQGAQTRWQVGHGVAGGYFCVRGGGGQASQSQHEHENNAGRQGECVSNG
jgi:hypothetical protein